MESSWSSARQGEGEAPTRWPAQPPHDLPDRPPPRSLPHPGVREREAVGQIPGLAAQAGRQLPRQPGPGVSAGEKRRTNPSRRVVRAVSLPDPTRRASPAPPRHRAPWGAMRRATVSTLRRCGGSCWSAITSESAVAASAAEVGKTAAKARRTLGGPIAVETTTFVRHATRTARPKRYDDGRGATSQPLKRLPVDRSRAVRLPPAATRHGRYPITRPGRTLPCRPRRYPRTAASAASATVTVGAAAADALGVTSSAAPTPSSGRASLRLTATRTLPIPSTPTHRPSRRRGRLACTTRSKRVM